MSVVRNKNWNIKKPIIIHCFLDKSFDEFCHLLKEVRVRFVGFGAEEDEWINVKNAVRERSIPLEHSECHKVKVGDLVCCFQVISIAVIIFVCPANLPYF